MAAYQGMLSYQRRLARRSWHFWYANVCFLDGCRISKLHRKISRLMLHIGVQVDRTEYNVGDASSGAVEVNVSEVGLMSVQPLRV